MFSRTCACEGMRVNVRTSGRVDEWTSGRVDVWTCGRVDVWTCGRVDADVWASCDGLVGVLAGVLQEGLVVGRGGLPHHSPLTTGTVPVPLSEPVHAVWRGRVGREALRAARTNGLFEAPSTRLQAPKKLRGKSTKLQVPSTREAPEKKHQAPGSKHQRSSTLQAPSSKLHALRSGYRGFASPRVPRSVGGRWSLCVERRASSVERRAS